MKFFTRVKSLLPKFNQRNTSIERRYSAMGGEFIFKCYPQDKISDMEIFVLFDEAISEVIRIENKFTDYRDSEFNQINKLAGKRPCLVDDEIYRLIQKSIDISSSSNGAFDITYASYGHAWRKSNQNEDIEYLKEFIDYKKIVFNDDEQSVFLPHEEMRIGLGGIGKGYAVDRAYDFLKEKGLVNFYVNGSGDIRVHSSVNAPRKWRLGIRNPFSLDKSKIVGVVQLSNGSVSTSGSYVRYNKKSKNFYDDHHIINTKSKCSNSDIVSATVLSEECIVSDTVGTILMTMSVKKALEFLENNSLMGIVIDKNGKSSMTKETLNFFNI